MFVLWLTVSFQPAELIQRLPSINFEIPYIALTDVSLSLAFLTFHCFLPCCFFYSVAQLFFYLCFILSSLINIFVFVISFCSFFISLQFLTELFFFLFALHFLHFSYVYLDLLTLSLSLLVYHYKNLQLWIKHC